MITGAAPPSTSSIRRITEAEALDLYRSTSIHELGRLAHAVTMRLHPEPYRTYIVDRNINYSNICTAKCAFCNFKVKPGDPRGYVLGLDDIAVAQHGVIAGGAQSHIDSPVTGVGGESDTFNHRSHLVQM